MQWTFQTSSAMRSHCSAKTKSGSITTTSSHTSWLMSFRWVPSVHARLVALWGMSTSAFLDLSLYTLAFLICRCTLCFSWSLFFSWSVAAHSAFLDHSSFLSLSLHTLLFSITLLFLNCRCTLCFSWSPFLFDLSLHTLLFLIWRCTLFFSWSVAAYSAFLDLSLHTLLFLISFLFLVCHCTLFFSWSVAAHSAFLDLSLHTLDQKSLNLVYRYFYRNHNNNFWVFSLSALRFRLGSVLM